MLLVPKHRSSVVCVVNDKDLDCAPRALFRRIGSACSLAGVVFPMNVMPSSIPFEPYHSTCCSACRSGCPSTCTSAHCAASCWSSVILHLLAQLDSPYAGQQRLNLTMMAMMRTLVVTVIVTVEMMVMVAVIMVLRTMAKVLMI